jgi:hypothetical protein
VIKVTFFFTTQYNMVQRTGYSTYQNGRIDNVSARANNLFSGGDSLIEDIPFERGDSPNLDPANYADGGDSGSWPPTMDIRGTQYGGDVCVGKSLVMTTFYAILVTIIIGLVVILHWGSPPGLDTRHVKISLGVVAVLAGMQAMGWYKKRT